jgi:hypothetical protein
VVDGVMYTTGPFSVVYALDARDGKLIWKYDPQSDRNRAGEACCDAVNRGVAVWKGKVYVGVLDGRLEAIDAKTGQRAWSVDTRADHKRSYTITGAPRVVNGKVVIGNGGAEFGVRGYVTAYDAETGQSISGATIKLWPVWWPVDDRFNRSTTTDKGGNYSVTGLEPGEYTIAPRKPGYGIRDRDWQSAKIIANESTTGIDFPLHKGLVVSGIVVDELNRPVADADVYAWQNECPTKKTKADSYGKFSLDDCVPNEPAYLTATKDVLSTEPGSPVVPSGDGATPARPKWKGLDW